MTAWASDLEEVKQKQTVSAQKMISDSGRHESLTQRRACGDAKHPKVSSVLLQQGDTLFTITADEWSLI